MFRYQEVVVGPHAYRTLSDSRSLFRDQDEIEKETVHYRKDATTSYFVHSISNGFEGWSKLYNRSVVNATSRHYYYQVRIHVHICASAGISSNLSPRLVTLSSINYICAQDEYHINLSGISCHHIYAASSLYETSNCTAIPHRPYCIQAKKC